eukprot:1181819-Prorocentrum_minimum.AAC.6
MATPPLDGGRSRVSRESSHEPALVGYERHSIHSCFHVPYILPGLVVPTQEFNKRLSSPPAAITTT